MEPVADNSHSAAIFATVRTYETSQTIPGVYTFDTFFATALAVLEQNVGIVAANVLPMGPLFSRRQRAAIRAESRMDRLPGASNRSSVKRTSMLIIEGPRKVGFEDTESSRGIMDSDNKSIAESVHSSDGWPRGIIKTVEVEVVEEDIADFERAGDGGGRGSRMSTLSIERDWAAILRTTPPGSRGPSRLA